MSEYVRYPHCDSSILHAPGKCEFCDLHPEMQEYREGARIAFTGEENEFGDGSVAPCPSTHFRAPEIRDRWLGNSARTEKRVQESMDEFIAGLQKVATSDEYREGSKKVRPKFWFRKGKQ